MTAYYNEHDDYAAAYLRNLIEAGHIAPGIVDERSIEDVRPSDLRGFTQCHFFAGVGVWSYALRSAGWTDDRSIWTGSCPCQPFSAAGKGSGFADERHLWPAFFHLIEQCAPAIVMGEQVASKDGLAWIDLVLTDLEGAGYAAGASDTCAAGFGAPHIRQRLYWLADATISGWREERADGGRFAGGNSAQGIAAGLEHGGMRGGMADSADFGRIGGRSSEASDGGDSPRIEPERLCDAGNGSRPTNGHWRAADWLGCTDGKWRPVEPGLEPLAHGASARVGRLRTYGNAIVAPQAIEVIRAYMEVAA